MVDKVKKGAIIKKLSERKSRASEGKREDLNARQRRLTEPGV